MTLPNFLIIGAPKAATTTIFNILRQHPDIFLYDVKEVGFFWAYGQDLNTQGKGIEVIKHRIINNLEDYRAVFAKGKDKKAIGEASVRYLSELRTPALIHQFIPQAKLIVSLRQPADRAFSSFSRRLRDGQEPCSSFAEAIEQERNGFREGWLYCRYLKQGFYYSSLQRYLKLFNRDQLHISLLEDLQNDPRNLVRDIFDFLGVDKNFLPDLSLCYNASGIIRNPILRYVWTHAYKYQGALSPVIPVRVRQKISEWAIKDIEKPIFALEVRKELTDYYREDIFKLQDLLGRDLSHWLEYKPDKMVEVDTRPDEE